MKEKILSGMKDKKVKKKYLKQNKGITLIALVITIVLNATHGRCEECIA